MKNKTIKPEKIFEHAHNLWRQKNKDIVGRFLAKVHNHNDIFKLACDVINENTFDLFQVLHLVGDALPFITSLNAENLIELCRVQHPKTCNDYASGVFPNKLEVRLRDDINVCSDIINLLKVSLTEETSSIYNVAVIAWAKKEPDIVINLILETVFNGSDFLAQNNIWLLGRLARLQCVSDKHKDAVWDKFNRGLSSQDTSIKNATIQALAEASIEWINATKKLLELGEAKDDTALAFIADLLFRNDEAIRHQGLFEPLLNCLLYIKPSAKGAIQNFDYVLQKIAEGGDIELAISYIENWVKNNDSRKLNIKILECFDNVFYKLFESPNVISNLVTKWLTKESMCYVLFVKEILEKLSVSKANNLIFDLDIVKNMNDKDFLFFIKRCLGVIINEEQAISSFSSLLIPEIIDNKYGLLFELFTEELGLDYPILTIEKLNNISLSEQNGKIKKLCEDASSFINNYMSALDVLPEIQELKPSKNMKEAFHKAENKRMQKSMEEGEKKSIVRQICAVVPIKAGIANFSLLEGNYSEPTGYMEFSSGFTLPRRFVLNSADYECRRSCLINVRKEKQG
ncbi:MAG: hypothetical protein AB7U85_06620 [Alphaproteobacteria bacterium]